MVLYIHAFANFLKERVLHIEANWSDDLMNTINNIILQVSSLDTYQCAQILFISIVGVWVKIIRIFRH